MTDSHQRIISALLLHQGHNSLLMPGTNHRIALPLSYGPALFNICWTLADRASIDNLTSSLNPTVISLFSLLLTSQILPKSPSISFIRIDMVIKRFMANWQFCSDLLGAKLLRNALKGRFEHTRLNAPGIATKQRSFPGKLIGFLGSVPAAPFVPSNFSRSGGLAPAKILGNLGVINSYFREAKNLVSFSLAEVFIGHCNLTVQVKKL